MEDTFRHKGLRKRMVEAIRAKGISDEAVLEGLNTVPRHLFLEKAFEDKAYDDQAMPIDEGQTISQPYTVAFQTALLKVQKRTKVLEIGTGSGYQAAILGAIGARVYTVERHELLHLKAKKIIDQLGLLNVRCYFGDGTKGLGEFAPFDRILITCAASEAPPLLLKQLTIGGLMVLPLGDSNSQTMTRITKKSETEYSYEKFEEFRFVPLLSGKNEIRS
jgi:protein-L-isoaspartate(D-aspartate) O-methyltransferase